MKNFNPLWLLAIPIAVLFVLALLSNRRKSPDTSDATGPTTVAEQKIFDAVMEWHKDVGAPLSESPDVFLATHFTKRGALVAQSCGLYRTKDLVIANETQDAFEVEPSPKGALTSAEMSRISKLVSELPPDQKPQQWRDTLVFTFLAGQKPQTRFYNRANLPPQVQEIYEIAEAPKP